MNIQMKDDMCAELHIQLAEAESRITYPLDHELEEEILGIQALIKEVEGSYTPAEKLEHTVEHYSESKKALLALTFDAQLRKNLSTKD